MSNTYRIFFILFFLLQPRAVLGDPINFIAAETRVDFNETPIRFETKIPLTLPYPVLGDEEKLAFVGNYYKANFEFSIDGRLCDLSLTEIKEEGSDTYFRGLLACERVFTFSKVSIVNSLFTDLAADVNHFVIIKSGDEEREIFFTKENIQYTDNAKLTAENNGPANWWKVAMQFVKLGLRHLIFGFDHVLFVLALHLLVRRLRDILLLATSFTIAHSITLILASYGIVTITGRIVEPVIAISIAYTAYRNILLFRHREFRVLRERWLTTFGFGLIHGLGFAGALAQISIPKEHFLSALLSFNVGIEIGQLVIISIFVPTLIYIQKKGYLSYAVFIFSSIISLISIYWFLDRIFV